jgi:hypothetical protein
VDYFTTLFLFDVLHNKYPAKLHLFAFVQGIKIYATFKTHILKCDVGQTSRLFTRFFEHYRGKGGVNTTEYCPEGIVAIYSAERLGKFFDYVEKVYNNDYNIYFDRNNPLKHFNDTDSTDFLQVENNITPCRQLEEDQRGEIYKV